MKRLPLFILFALMLIAQVVVVLPIHAENPSPATDHPLPCIRRYEQGRDGYRTNTGNGYYGAYQFDRGTWDSNARKGPHTDWVGVRPDRAPADIQDSMARVLYHRRGLQPWGRAVRRHCR